MSEEEKETKTEIAVIKQDVIDSFTDSIHSKYLRIHSKAKEFIDSLESLVEAVTGFKNHCKDKQLTLNGKNVNFKDFINGSTKKLGFGYSQFNKYSSLKGQFPVIRNMLIEAEPEYILCHKVKVTPSVDNIKLALGDTNPWVKDDTPTETKSVYEQVKSRFAEKEQKITDQKLKTNAEKALEAIQKAEAQKEKYQDLISQSSDNISDLRKVISKAIASVPKETTAKSNKTTKPAPKEIDVDKVIASVDALPTI